MRLKYAQIKNYRSIAEAQIDFEPRCRVLVGINEAGKTNILKALSLLDPDATIKAEDIRDPRPGEPYDQEAYVRFVFVLDESDRANIEAAIRSHIYLVEPDSPLVVNDNNPCSISQFLQYTSEILYVVNLRTKKRIFSFWALPKHFHLAAGWKKPAKECPPDYQIGLPSGKQTPLSSFALFLDTDLPDIPSAYSIDADIKDLSAVTNLDTKQVVADQLPSCVFWTYNEASLLPGKIPLSTFLSNPDACIPLKHMFWLAGIHDISAALTEAQNRSNGLRNVLNRVADLSTRHMRTVWPEYKKLSISLSQNGDQIDAAIQDKHNLYNMSRRSDGFKRFISFLLLISAKVKTDDLTNTLYLHDEPDTSLHPSGARHLRDELIRIADKNYVVYATHSIFMIDPDHINRHLIVEKVDEATSLKDVTESDVIDEEVLFNALNYSIFQNLKRENIIFEGWRDKRLFIVATSKFPNKHRGLQKLFAPVGKCHAKGVKNLCYIASMLELGDRRYVVLSDSDALARQYQKEFHGEGSWLRYDELITDVVAVTGEDFIEPGAFLPILEKLSAENRKLPQLTTPQLDDSQGRLAAISKWLTSHGVERGQVKAMLNVIKEAVFANLTPDQVLPSYYEMLGKLADHFPRPPNNE